jgi:pimeloyl-ACP methyl ester carboxylesterase
MPRAIALVGLIACGIGGFASAAESPAALRTEMQQRDSGLVQRGFNLTDSFVLGGVRDKVAHIDLLVPPSSGPHELDFWARALSGDVEFRATAADGRLLASWSGQSGETNLTLVLPGGRIRVEVDGSHADSVFGLLGVKGPVLRTCRLDPTRVSTHSAKPSAGFHWPYLLYMPHEFRAPFLLAAPNNTGFVTTDPELLAADGTCTAERAADLADHLGIPVLVPLFPRPSVAGEEESLYLHALTRASLLTQIPEYARVDLQFMAMLDDATSALMNQGRTVSQRILITGFSASGSFASRFAMLHPDRVLAVAAGAPGGWPIAPVAKDRGSALPYPIGIGDLESLIGSTPAMSSLRRVAWFFYLGDRDTNDSVPYRDSFSKADETLIVHRFGSSLVTRWKEAERLYRGNGLDARFKLYPGVAHEVSREMQEDIEAFFVATARSGKEP